MRSTILTPTRSHTLNEGEGVTREGLTITIQRAISAVVGFTSDGRVRLKLRKPNAQRANAALPEIPKEF